MTASLLSASHVVQAGVLAGPAVRFADASSDGANLSAPALYRLPGQKKKSALCLQRPSLFAGLNTPTPVPMDVFKGEGEMTLQCSTVQLKNIPTRTTSPGSQYLSVCSPKDLHAPQ